MKKNILIAATTILLIGTFMFTGDKNVIKGKILKVSNQQIIKNKKNIKPKISQEIIINKKNKSLYTFKDNKWNLSVDFPKNLYYKIDSTSNTPDSGIKIFLDKNNKKNVYDRDYIFIYGCTGHLSTQVYKSTKKTSFITNQKVKGYLYITKNKFKKGYTEVSLILGDGFIGAKVICKNENYNKKGKDIINIFKSINLYNKSDREFTPKYYSEDKVE